jgi:hypothetical protein
VGVAQRGDGVAAEIDECVALVAGMIPAGGFSGRLGGYLVLVELHQVVGGGDQPPF